MMLWVWMACQNTEKSTDSGVAILNGDSGEESTEENDTAVLDSGVDEDVDDALLSEECDDVYLLELDFQNQPPAQIWRYDLSTQGLADLGPLQCPMQRAGDLLVAMSADSKGFLWFTIESTKFSNSKVSALYDLIFC